MTITTQDVKLFQSQRLTDAADGGGRMGGTVVVDGLLNNLFTDISRLDRLLGRDSYRKAYITAVSNNSDVWLGVHLVLTDPPLDDDVAVVMFAAKDEEETRGGAASRVEAWTLARSVPDPSLVLVGTPAAGAVNILAAAPTSAYTEEDLPTFPGSRICLRVTEGSLEGQQQIVRYTEVTAQTIDLPGDTNYVLLNYRLEAPLSFDFPGTPEDDYTADSPTRLYEVNEGTPLARDITYYGVSKLASSVTAGATSLPASQITAQISPLTVGDPALVGIDPTNLHATRRVPIFRAGNAVVIHNTATIELPSVVAGGTYDLEREALSYVALRDQDGQRIPTDRYTVNYDDGEVTMADPLDLDGYTQPLVATHIVEDRAVLTSVPAALGELVTDANSTHEGDTLLDIGRPFSSVRIEIDGREVFEDRTASFNAGTGVWTLTATDPRGTPTAITMVFTVDFEDGTVILTSSDASTGTDVLISWAAGEAALELDTPITRNYATSGTFISTVLPIGDLQSRVFNLFSQQAWTTVWSDSQIGLGTSGQYNDSAYPITTTNKGAITQRWRAEFTSTTAFRVVGEFVGQVATGDTSTDLAPINPATGVPYFFMDRRGWGSGWQPGNVVRWNEEACAAPLWFIRATPPGPDVEPTDRVKVLLRGDAN